jgi:glycosyltransferase involved in cell wall biosynthesis
LNNPAFRPPPGPILLIEPEAATIGAALDRLGGREVLCASASADCLARLRGEVGPAPAVVFFRGDIPAVLRAFPLFWAEIHLFGVSGAAELAEALAGGGRLIWRSPQPAQATAGAIGLVERGLYAGFEAAGDDIVLSGCPGMPPCAGLSPVPGWAKLRILLDAIDAGAAAEAAAVGAAIRPFRQGWLVGADRALSGGWPYRAESPGKWPATLPDGRPWPRISIVTPSFNQARYIEETLLSVRRQNYPDVEHIVIDGGSTDGTMAIVDRYRDGLSQVVSEADRGQSHAINKGMALATGEILTWLNSDDMLAPGALASAALGFATSGADLVAGICRIHRDGELLEEHLTACADGPLPLDDLLDLDGGWNAGQFFYQPEVLFTRALWQRAGARVDESLYYNLDYELWLRFAEQGGRLHVLGRPIAWFRRHDAQKTHDDADCKAELTALRDLYLARTGRRLPPPRPPADHRRRLRVAMVNDIGWHYGAGIAQRRLAEAIERAGHETISLALTETAVPAGEPSAVTIDQLEDRIARCRPDLVLFGNVHGARVEPAALAPIFERWPSLIVLHDLWWLTGRCIYNGTCRKYLTGCDAACPTPDEYPALAPDRIARAWRDKRLLYAASQAPVLLANSDWALATARAALAGDADPPSRAVTVERIRLGFPLDIFRPRDRRACRDRLGLPQDRFIVVASAASLLEPRKGADQLRDVVGRTELPGLLFLTVGHGDVGGLDLPEGRLIGLGEIDDPERLAEIYAAADVLVSPSTEETFGQVFIEAAACGTPVVGHAVTGVAEAVRAGVTGLLTATADAAGLDAALLELYRRPLLRDALAVWGRLHCENEYSYAACYHSLFVALGRAGLADHLGLARKITFPAKPAVPAAPDLLGTGAALWQRGAGIGPLEGPHPQHGIHAAFHWCCGPDSRFDLWVRQPGRQLLVLEYQNLYFEALAMTLREGARELGHAVLEHTSVTRSALAAFSLELDAGRHTLVFGFGQWREPDSSDPRRLAMMLRAVDLIPL